MSYENPLIAKWKAGQPTIGAWLTTCDPTVAEHLANTGVDEVTADQQHSTIGVVHENAADGAFAYQLLGGIRANVTDRMFLFTEYKYLVANYQWESEFANGSRGPSFTLNYRTHIIAGGLGVTF